jgi:TRAP-type uncharacterized transport system substrate-binding protein
MKRHYFWIGAAAILAMALLLIILIRHNTAPHRVVLLTGPAGGGGERLGRTLAERIRLPGMWDLSRKRYQLVTESSDGFEDNRQRVDRDTRGNLVGFAHDGFNPTSNVQILLPLEESFVHIIVSKRCYQAACELCSDCPAARGERLFRHLVPLLKAAGDEPASAQPAARIDMSHKAFLGPRLSGTRQTAELILQHYGVPIGPIDSQFEYDWEEMFVALVEGRIHLAFFTTEPGVGVVQRLACRGDFHLLGLDDTEGIARTHPFVLRRDFPANSYGCNDFCAAKTDTIATRRVIVCSRQLNPEDGYWLSMQLADAIREEVPTIRWKRSESEQVDDGDFTYPLHASASLFAKERTPWYAFIPSPFWPLVITAGLGIVALGLRQVAGESQQPSPQAAAPEAAAAEPPQLAREVSDSIQELGRVEDPMTESVYRKWKRKGAQFTRELVQQTKTGNISAEEKELIAHGIGEFIAELELSRPAPPKQANRKKQEAAGKPNPK